MQTKNNAIETTEQNNTPLAGAGLRLVANADGWREVDVNGYIAIVPTGWEIKNISQAFDVAGGGTPPTQEPSYWGGDIVWTGPKYMGDDRRYVDIIHPDNRRLTPRGAAKVSNRITPKGSLIISSRAPVGYANLAPCDLYTNQGCYSLIENGSASCEYGYFWARKNKHVLDNNASGTTFMEISRSKLSNLEVLLPPFPEQRRIAAILTNQESHIHDLLALRDDERARLAWLTEELLSGRVRVVERIDGESIVVARDGSGNPVETLDALDLVPNRDGWHDVELNGEIVGAPNDWKANKAKDLYHIGAGISAPKDAGPMNNDLIPFVRVSDLAKQKGRDILETRDCVSAAYSRYIQPAGTLVFAKSGESIRGNLRKLLGKNSVVVGHLACLRAKPAMDNNFGYWCWTQIDFENDLTQTSLPALGLGDIGDKVILTPALPEQQRIAAVLSAQERQVADIDALIKVEQERLAWLAEELLSGRIRVEVSNRESA